jgi:uncharacterized OB-fold protein
MARNEAPSMAEGWVTLDGPIARLRGNKCEDCGTCFFPPQQTGCRNSQCGSPRITQTTLSNVGALWSYTSSIEFPAKSTQRPEWIAAVYLAAEKMIVLGPVARGTDPTRLAVGVAMQLVAEEWGGAGEGCDLAWKWKPI